MRYLAILTILAISAQCFAATKAFEVSATGDLKCQAFLHLPDTSEKVPLVLEQMGSGIYSTASTEEASSVAEYLLENKKAAILTINKPGIIHTNYKGYTLVEAQYNQYKQADLIQCALNALKQTMLHDSIQSDRILLYGHSEGSQVLTRFYAKILETEPALYKNIKGIFLGGIPMQGWKDIIDYQLKDDAETKNKFWAAIERKDNQALREITDLAYDYWEDILKTETLVDSFKKLADQQPNAHFSFYQGIFDQNTVVGPVMDFEKWNIERKKDDKKSLKLMVRYYQAR